MIQSSVEPAPTIATGVPGLDEVLGGGYGAGRMHLVQGPPGAGKTTIALQFLLDGAASAETTLYVALAETADELRVVARSHGWALDLVHIYELVPSVERLEPSAQNSILPPGEAEFTETIWSVLEEVARLEPTRVVIDSLAELRLLAGDAIHYRRQLLAMKEFFAGRDCTLLVLDHVWPEGQSVESIAHSVLELEQTTPEMGGSRRRLHVRKIRGSAYRSGYHDFVMETGGVRVFPRLVAAEHRDLPEANQISSGVDHLDALLGGGLTAGTSTLLIGPAGAGKSAIATQFIVSAANRGTKAAIFLFEEAAHTFLTRTQGLGLDLISSVEQGMVTLRELSPAEVPPGQFDDLAREAVEYGAEIVLIDSLNGYLNAMSEEKMMLLRLHELLTFLSSQNVLSIMTIAQHGLIGGAMNSPVDASYLADTVILLRYFEAAGALHQAISVVKKRTGPHERTIRELKLGPGVQVGEPLHAFHGVLTGVPVFSGASDGLLPPNG